MSFKIGKREVGGGRCFVVGEVGLAHDGSLQAAHAFIDAIHKAGADACKFQLHLADHEPDAPMRVPGVAYRTRHEQWRRTAFDAREWASLKLHAELNGLEFLCSPFSVEAVKLLDPLVPAWKVPSGEATNWPLWQAMAATGKPMLISTGMSSTYEIFEGVNGAWPWPAVPVALMQCTSEYPVSPERLGLNVIRRMRDWDAYRPVGLSDHSGNIFAGLAAVTLGCDVLEVHIKLSEWDQGPDASSSITPAQLRQLVDGIRWIERAKAHPVDKDLLAKELEPMRKLFMRQPVNA